MTSPREVRRERKKTGKPWGTFTLKKEVSEVRNSAKQLTEGTKELGRRKTQRGQCPGSQRKKLQEVGVINVTNCGKLPRG